MKKIFTIAAAMLASFTLMAQTAIFGPFTVNTGTNVKDQENAVNGGIAVLSKIFDSGGSNEVTIADQTFYKFSSSTAVKCTLSEGTFEEGDSIEVIVASHASSKKTTGVKLNNSIDVFGEVPGGEAAKFSYIVKAEDGIAGQTNFTVNRYNSDSKFGTITVFRESVTPSTDPVSEVTVTGPTEGFVGIPVTLKAKTDKKADKIWWTDKYGTTLSEKAEFTFTPEAEGEVTYTAWAENEYNVSPALKEHTLTIAGKLCGELIKATSTGETTASVEGVIGGSVDKKTNSSGKFSGKGQYFGITLASGTFLAGDELNVHTTTAAEQGTLAIYADKAGETLLYDSESFGAEGDNIIYLPAALNEKSTLYICRTETNTWNGFVDFISVTRSCEASNNADVSEVRVNGVVVEPEGEKGILYNYTLGASYSEPTVSIALTLAHPKATIKYGLDNPYEMSTPDAGSSKGQAFTIVAEDGVTEKTITVNVAKSATLSNDWKLSALSIDGYTLDPAFDPEINVYTITKPYGAANPEESAVHATPRHPGATIQSITINEASIVVTVLAEDGETSNGYAIDILEAAAKKDLLEVSFSNGVHGFIKDGNIQVPYLAGEAEPAFEGVKFWNPDGEPTAAIEEGQLVVTGIDGKKASYTLEFIAVTPMEYSAEEVVFSEVPSYIFSVYGFDADKGVKFSKDVEESANRRISEGKDRIYLALPAAGKVILTSGTGASRPVVITVNGVESTVNKTAKENEAIEIGLSTEGNNFVAIESNGNSGDAGFIKLQLSQDKPMAIDYTTDDVKAVKFIQNGQIFILRGEKIYTITGQEL
ncbi:MAG: hypothetical protein IJS57_06130 [Paludibacteraceae bacterium]|nr:hypothetical protein [Paludibacteraceae bacterium]